MGPGSLGQKYWDDLRKVQGKRADKSEKEVAIVSCLGQLLGTEKELNTVRKELEESKRAQEEKEEEIKKLREQQEERIEQIRTERRRRLRN